MGFRRDGRGVRQRSAKPFTPVQVWFAPPKLKYECLPWWRNSRRWGLKSPWPSGRVGATPTLGTSSSEGEDWQMSDILFDVMTPLGFHVRVTRSYWKIIVSVKHPIMAGHEKDVKNALQNPEEIRRSKKDTSVYLFYKS